MERKILIDLRRTMESGQTVHFTWERENGRYWRVVEGERCEIWKGEDGRLNFTEGFGKYVEKTLRLDDDLSAIYKKINTDGRMASAISSYPGLRLTQSDPWETLVAYVCSINNNMKRIRQNVRALMVAEEGRMREPDEIARMDLAKVKLGYRQKFIERIVQNIHSYELDKIYSMPYHDARETLTELHGVGTKVADCILLYGYGKLEAFPTDVWIKKALKKWYKLNPTEKRTREFAARKWKGLAGYAQQYLFEAARERLAERKSRAVPAIT